MSKTVEERLATIEADLKTLISLGRDQHKRLNDLEMLVGDLRTRLAYFMGGGAAAVTILSLIIAASHLWAK